MADGDVLTPGPGGMPGTQGSIAYKLLDSASNVGPDNGVWVPCAEYDTGVVIVTGATAALVIEVDGKNDLTQPVPSDNGVSLGATTAGQNGVIQVLVLPRWIKARIATAGAAGNVNAFALLRGSGSG